MSTALYNRYRPATFSQVVGQEHVTSALMQALRTGRLHHAYLFSGPRGCGKTSSARILAASLNCEQGPTPEPCGVCDQCVSIRTGSSMDVTEIDAASHGLVDDARDLRERAFFAPASARFKIFVVDEAHMVTAAAFNALLKVVEEPPPYLKFVFATTEPDKVIATIRSRTHHYAFRLVPPGILREHLANIAAAEGVEVDPAVLPLVVRAGAGSVRDSLSVLDQLLAGAGPEGLHYDRAVALLGMTDGVLLDETVDALAARDGATLFTVVDKVVGSGHDPRRFTADLLERMRDLLMLKAVPDAVERGLLDAFSADQVERMKTQAGRVGPAELSRTADVLHAGLGEMRGTASPRLLLELVLARALLPGAATDTSALLTRLERLERGLAAGVPLAAPPAAGTGGAAAAPSMPAAPAGPAPAGPTPAWPGRGPEPAGVPGTRPAAPMSGPGSGPAMTLADRSDGRGAAPVAGAAAPASRPPAQPSSATAGPAAFGGPSPTSGPSATGGSGSPGGPNGTGSPGDVGGGPDSSSGTAGPEAATVRAMWDQVLAGARRRKQTTYALLTEYASVLDVRANELFLAFSAPRIAQMFGQGAHIDVLCEALAEQFGGGWRVTIGEPGSGGSRPAAGAPRGGPSWPPAAPSAGGFAPARQTPATPPHGTLRPPAGFTPATLGGGPAAPAHGGGFAAAGGFTGGPAGGFSPSPAAAGVPAPPASDALHAAVRGPLGPGLDPSADALAVPGASRPGLGTPGPPANRRDGAIPARPATPPGGGGPAGALATATAGGPAALASGGAGTAGVAASDEPSLDDEDAPAHPGATLSGEAAAMELLRVGLGATIIDP